MRYFLFLCILCFSVTIHAQTSKKPNIIVFLVDDMGWQDTSVVFTQKPTPNNEKYRTPNMEKLANQGITYTNAYAASVCSPSRVSLITGANAARHRVTNWTLNYNTATDVENETLIPPVWNVNGIATTDTLPNSYYVTPLPMLLKEAGYHTISVGKAHFGAKGTPAENPLHLGFEVNIAGHAAGGLSNYSGLDNFGNRTDGKTQSPFAIPDLEAYWGKDISVTEALTLEAIKTLENRPKDKPFFLYLSHYAVHTPIEADKRFLQKYIDKGLDVTEAKYASMVEAMDKSLGDILKYVSENQLFENTFILFLSDNGGLTFRGGSPVELNAPLRSGKGSAYEGGIRVPMIASWGEKIKKGKNHSLIMIEDVFPTLLELAQVKDFKTVQVVDGKSFTSTFEQHHINKNRSLFWHFPNNWYVLKGNGFGASSTIRRGNWKLIYFYESQKIELFNLKKDIGETTDLSKKFPRKTQKLRRKLTEYLKSTNAQLPIMKTNGKEASYPSDI